MVNLADELLPPLPQGTTSLPICSNILVKGSAVKRTSVSTSGKQEDTNGASNEVSAREKLLHDQPELLQQFGLDLLPVLTQVCALKEFCVVYLMCTIYMFQVDLDIFVFHGPDIWFQCKWPCSPQVSFCDMEADVFQLS